ncbi:MAG: dolichyl-phosphate beta-glucosyltransferase [Candidatus Dormibacteria bacterium]
MISVVIPAYNESARLPPTLARIREHLDAGPDQYEVLVVDDGSHDDTAALAESVAAAWLQLRVIRLSVNRGKGAAVRAGMLAATGELRLFSDADLSTPMAELGLLRSRIDAGYGVAIASRALPGTTIEVHQNRRRETMGRIYNVFLRLLVLPDIHDSQCGFKLFTAAAARTSFEPLRTERFGFDAEVLVRARRAGIRIAEVPVRWRHVEESRVSSVRDASRMLLDLVILRLRGT